MDIEKSGYDPMLSIEGQKIYRYTVIRKFVLNQKTRVECVCSCGTKRIVTLTTLLHGYSRSCGCLQKEVISQLRSGTMKDFIGSTFGRLTILAQWRDKSKSQSVTKVSAKCTCGDIKQYFLYSLKNGKTTSCGCFLKEVSSRRSKTHGRSGTPEYVVWSKMIQRCNNPNHTAYKSYGKRGIKICDSWLKFENFYEDMGDRPLGLELDRKDTNKGYYKENCRWTTSTVNNQNSRKSKWWVVDGIRYSSCTEASKLLSVTPGTIVRWCNNNGRKDCYSELKYPSK